MTEPARTDRPSTVPWPPILLIGIVVGAITLEAFYPIQWPGLNDLPAQFVGLTIGCLGVLLMIWAFYTFHRHRTTVMPHQAATSLITDGPFRRFRNPIYLADAMILLGVAELTKNAWFLFGAATFVPLVTWLAILPEERHLSQRFGGVYESYKARTRRWI